MNTPIQKESFYASCPYLLEELLANECRAVGIEKLKVAPGGVLFGAAPFDALRFLCESRIASRLFRQITHFTFTTQAELVSKVALIDWINEIRLSQTFKIRVSFDQPTELVLKNSLYISQIIKDPIVDQFREKLGVRPNVDPKFANVSIFVRIEEACVANPEEEILQTFRANIYIDLAGFPLSNRGYRQTTHEAPIRENLGAALVLSTDFDPSKDVLIDLMCGSGTLLIEAALIAGKIPPAYLRMIDIVENKGRPFTFQHSNWYFTYENLQSSFENYLKEQVPLIKQALATLPEGQFYGCDISKIALKEARRSVSGALLKQVISLTNEDGTKRMPPCEAPGVILSNPPYGERLEDEKTLEPLYYELGEHLKRNFKGYRAYLFTSSTHLRKQISLHTSERIALRNGSLDCRLLKYDLF